VTTCRQRFLDALHCRPTDRPPAWFMRQAGRYLPEYRELRSTQTFMETLADAERAAEITLQPIRRFGMDAAVVFSDILVPLAAMGMGLEFESGVGPVLTPPVRDMDGVRALHDFDPNVAVAHLAETLRICRRELDSGAFASHDLGGRNAGPRGLIGFCGAPFTVASYAVEGRGSRTFEHTKKMMWTEPRTFDALLSRIVDVSLPYLALQVASGADVLQLFDSWGGALDAVTYRRAVLPHLMRLVKGARDLGVPVIVYMNGGSHLLDELLASEPSALAIDWRVVPKVASAKVGPHVALQGNIDPIVFLADAAAVRSETARTLAAFEGHPGYVFNVGSGFVPATVPENVAVALETVRG
jgi:uroporphyrinogen decarboxylase